MPGSRPLQIVTFVLLSLTPMGRLPGEESPAAPPTSPTVPSASAAAPAPVAAPVPAPAAAPAAVNRPKGEPTLPAVESRAPRTWRSTKSELDYPRSVNVIDAEEMARTPRGVAIDQLRFEPGIWMDHRTTTTTDPVMRGMAGGNLLYTVDGNTVSTLWGEGGFGSDDMYGKVDPFTVERIEVIRGPGSVLYGSNALGGVVNLISRSAPHDYTENSDIAYGGATRTSYGSAADAYTARQEGWVAGSFYRLLVGATAIDANDVEGGRGEGTFRNTSGEDYNYDLAVDARPVDKIDLRLTWQDTDRNHTHRYYRPFQDNFNDREALALSVVLTEPAPWWERVEVSYYLQEKRDRRRFNESVKLANGITLGAPRGEAVTRTWEPRVEMVTRAGDHAFTYGAMAEMSRGESPDDEEFTYEFAGQHWKSSPDALWRNLGIFGQHEWEATDFLTVTSGLRYDTFRFGAAPDGSVAVAPAVNPASLGIHDQTGAVTGGVGATADVADGHKVFANFSRGFRQFAPVLSVAQVGGGVRVPSGLLDPVWSYSWEVGYKTRQPVWQAEASFYRTRFDGFSTDDVPGTFLGQDWFDFNGNGTRDGTENVVVFKTRGWAYVYGVDAAGETRLSDIWDLPDLWTVGANFSWNIGSTSAREATGRRTPVRFVQPAHGVLRAKWEDADKDGHPLGLWTEVVGESAFRFTQIPLERKNDPVYRRDPARFHYDKTVPIIRSRADNAGIPRHLPGWSELHLYAGYRVNDNLTFTAGVENIGDVSVRRAHSRMSDPGTNFTFGLTATY
ncbi:MAG: TonB-dependent receptor [Planctomycetes bacterium]|nr:TonB-dependent receptor [Planctomycetota bacterium]